MEMITAAVAAGVAALRGAAIKAVEDAYSGLKAAIVARLPRMTSRVGVDLERVRAGTIDVEDVQGAHAGIRGRDWHADGAVTIRRVRGEGGPDPN